MKPTTYSHIRAIRMAILADIQTQIFHGSSWIYKDAPSNLADHLADVFASAADHRNMVRLITKIIRKSMGDDVPSVWRSIPRTSVAPP